MDLVCDNWIKHENTVVSLQVPRGTFYYHVTNKTLITLSKRKDEKGVRGGRKRYFVSTLRTWKEGERNRKAWETPTPVDD